MNSSVEGEPVAPDTIPDFSKDAELVEALEWLRKKGVVNSTEKPPFQGFFDEK